MNQRKNSIERNQLRTVGLSRIIPILFVLMIFRSVLSQDFVFLATPRAKWASVACSADGTKLAAFAADKPYNDTWLSQGIYVSSDSGATWSKSNLQLEPCCPYGSLSAGNFLALTPDATTLVAVSLFHLIYTSHDLGITWNTNVFPGALEQIALSNDGNKWVCAQPFGYPGPIYISDDSGASWKATSAPVTNWSSVACSADGSFLVAVQRTGQVYISPNRGLDWESQIPASPTNSFYLAVCSADGNKLVALGDLVCVSTNAGANWTTIGSQPPVEPNVAYIGTYRPLDRVAASADATRLIGLRVGLNSFWTSTNSGAQWVLQYQPPSLANAFLGIASSANGSRWLAAGSWFPYTWPPPPVALSISLQGTNLALSWPSNQVGFVMESAPSLSPSATWSAVTNDVFLGNYRFNVTASPNTSPTYFRLRKP